MRGTCQQQDSLEHFKSLVVVTDRQLQFRSFGMASELQERCSEGYRTYTDAGVRQSLVRILN